MKQIRRAVLRGGKTPEGLVVAEGPHLLEEALRSGRPVRRVVAANAAAEAVEGLLCLDSGLPVTWVDDRLFGRLTSTEASQGVIALVEPPVWTTADLFRGVPLVAVLDGVQDPGNVGAILRAAEAFGATGALLLTGTAALANPKTLRGSAGSCFRLPLIEAVSLEQAASLLARHRLALYAASPQAGRTIEKTDLRRPCALIFGNEGSGVREPWRTRAAAIRIPTKGVESLNVAVAAGIFFYEALRQRRTRL